MVADDPLYARPPRPGTSDMTKGDSLVAQRATEVAWGSVWKAFADLHKRRVGVLQTENEMLWNIAIDLIGEIIHLRPIDGVGGVIPDLADRAEAHRQTLQRYAEAQQ
jgi:hypothetical protein